MLSVVNKPLRIALLGVSDRERARLEFFIDHHWSSNCHLVAEDCADLCILDLDSLEGEKLLEQQQDCHPGRPLIVLTIHNPEINDVSLLRKPLDSELLKNTIDDHITAFFDQPPMDDVPESVSEPAFEFPRQLNSAVNHSEISPPPLQNKSLAPSVEPVFEIPKELNSAIIQSEINHRRSALPNATAQARIVRNSCGSAGIIEFDNQFNRKNLYYNPSGLLQQVLKKAIDQCRREARPLRVNLPADKYIALFPKNHTALSNLSDSKLRSRCLLPVNSRQIHIDYPSLSENNQIRTDAEVTQDISSLLWKITLWSARGRLPHGTNIDTTITLRQWPNLTRLLAIPQFFRIAALWVKTPFSLKNTARELNIEARYVCAFFSACNALELTQTLSTTEDGVDLENNKKRSTAPRRLLSRILRHLRLT
jgi:hypothetical protein